MVHPNPSIRSHPDGRLVRGRHSKQLILRLEDGRSEAVYPKAL